jgi:hypothetical protein
MEDNSCESTDEKSNIVIGAKRSRDWLHFSDRDDVTTLNSAECRHCKKQVSYGRQIKRVQKHLRTCESFITYCQE